MGQGRRRITWAMAGVCMAGTACSGAGARTDAPATASAPTPTFAKTVVLAPVAGKVLIDLPGGASSFARLTGGRVVPLGTVVNATAGRVMLTSANPGPKPAAVQSGQFFRGIFRVEQGRTAGGLVDLVIRDNLPGASCQAGAAHSAALSQKVLGLLRGTAKGRFRTTGRFSAATVRGTDWGVRDRCDGTLTVVRTGVVVVRDFRLHRDVIVRAGQTYMAKAP